MGRWLLPVIAVMVIAADAILYAWLLAQQDGTGPSMTWFLVGMAAAALLAIYGAIPGIPLRRTALVVAGAGLLVLGRAGTGICRGAASCRGGAVLDRWDELGRGASGLTGDWRGDG